MPYYTILCAFGTERSYIGRIHQGVRVVILCAFGTERSYLGRTQQGVRVLILCAFGTERSYLGRTHQGVRVLILPEDSNLLHVGFRRIATNASRQTGGERCALAGHLVYHTNTVPL